MRRNLKQTTSLIWSSKRGLLAGFLAAFVLKSCSYVSEERVGVVGHVLDLRDPDWLSPVLWWSVTILLAVATLRNKPRLHALALGVACGFLFLWSMLFIWSVPAAFLSRGSIFLLVLWVTAWGLAQSEQVAKLVVKTKEYHGDGIPD